MVRREDLTGPVRVPTVGRKGAPSIPWGSQAPGSFLPHPGICRLLNLLRPLGRLELPGCLRSGRPTSCSRRWSVTSKLWTDSVPWWNSAPGNSRSWMFFGAIGCWILRTLIMGNSSRCGTPYGLPSRPWKMWFGVRFSRKASVSHQVAWSTASSISRPPSRAVPCSSAGVGERQRSWPGMRSTRASWGGRNSWAISPSRWGGSRDQGGRAPRIDLSLPVRGT